MGGCSSAPAVDPRVDVVLSQLEKIKNTADFDTTLTRNNRLKALVIRIANLEKQTAADQALIVRYLKAVHPPPPNDAKKTLNQVLSRLAYKASSRSSSRDLLEPSLREDDEHGHDNNGHNFANHQRNAHAQRNDAVVDVVKLSSSWEPLIDKASGSRNVTGNNVATVMNSGYRHADTDVASNHDGAQRRRSTPDLELENTEYSEHVTTTQENPNVDVIVHDNEVNVATADGSPIIDGKRSLIPSLSREKINNFLDTHAEHGPRQPRHVLTGTTKAPEESQHGEHSHLHRSARENMAHGQPSLGLVRSAAVVEEWPSVHVSHVNLIEQHVDDFSSRNVPHLRSHRVDSVNSTYDQLEFVHSVNSSVSLDNDSVLDSLSASRIETDPDLRSAVALHSRESEEDASNAIGDNHVKITTAADDGANEIESSTCDQLHDHEDGVEHADTMDIHPFADVDTSVGDCAALTEEMDLNADWYGTPAATAMPHSAVPASVVETKDPDLNAPQGMSATPMPATAHARTEAQGTDVVSATADPGVGGATPLIARTAWGDAPTAVLSSSEDSDESDPDDELGDVIIDSTRAPSFGPEQLLALMCGVAFDDVARGSADEEQAPSFLLTSPTAEDLPPMPLTSHSDDDTDTEC